MNIERELAANLAAYIPITLTQRILAGQIPQPGQSRTCQAATLFSDISGFTSLSEELAADGPRGAEELNRVLLLTFTGMIDLIHEMGGAVNHFHGDAMSVYFPDEDGGAAQRALTCAQKMQRLMLTSLSRVVANRPVDKDPFFDLTMKIGLGYGRCRETIIGDPAAIMEHVLAGPAVDQAAAAEKQAQANEIIASRTILNKVGLPAPDEFNIISNHVDWIPPHPVLDWTEYDDSALERLITAVKPFLPDTIYERTISGLSEMAEHRPVASIFVQFDLHQDEADTLKLQQYFQWANQVVGRFGGRNARLNRVLTGDKGNQLHIIFGAPVAPDAPEQAVRCALALQREQPAYVKAQRIGLATGKVFACPVGAAKRREYTVVGDVVNLSARLTQICPDGKLLTDRATAERVRSTIDFDELPPMRLKGKQAKVALFQARDDQEAGERESQAQLQIFVKRWERPLIGRQQELTLLSNGLKTALKGSGGTAAVIGATGVGKTSLVAVATKHWLDSGGVALAGEGHQHTNDVPFGPWRSIWRGLLGLTATMGDKAQITAVTQRTLALIPGSDEDVGLWGDVMGLPIPQTERLRELTAEVRQARFFNMARRFMQAAAAEQPLLIILEGLHWADQSTLAFIDEISNHLANHPIFLALTFRPSVELALETLNRPNCVPIILSDLPPKHGRQLLDQLIGTASLPSAVEQHLGLRGRDGMESPVNPLFLEEAVNMMMGLGVLTQNGRLQINESLLTQMQIPDTIHGLLLARIDRLPVASRDLLQVASVIGRQFNLDPLVSISPDTPREVATALLEELSVEEITQLMTTDPEWSYLFQHAMTHEVAYESLPFIRRQTLHAAVADWLVNRYEDNLKPLYAVLAYHYSRADDHENGLRFSLAAADSARDLFANQEAVELYTLAESHLGFLDKEKHWETAVNIYLSHGYVMRFLGDFTVATQYIEAALKLAREHHDVPKSAHAYNLLADIRYRQAQYEKAITAANEVIENLEPHIPNRELTLAYLWLGMNNSALGRFSEAQIHLKKAEELCLASQDNQRLARVLEAIAFVYYQQKDLQAALIALQNSVRLSRHVSTPMNLASSLNNIALVQHQLGEAEEALQTLNESIELVRETSRNFLARFTGNRAEILTYLGRFSDAQADYEQAIDLFMLMDDEQALSELYLVMGYEHYSMMDRWDEARDCLQKAEALITSQGEEVTEKQARLHIGKGQLALHSGSFTQAKKHFEMALDIIKGKNIAWWRPIAHYFLAQVQIQSGKLEVAKQSLLTAVEAIDNEGCPDYLPLILYSMAQLNQEGSPDFTNLEKCVQAAGKRARFLDKIKCFERVGTIFTTHGNIEQKVYGRNLLDKANQLKSQLNFN